MSKKEMIDWIEQYVRLGHLIIGLIILAVSGLVTATWAWADVTHEIKDLKAGQATAANKLIKIQSDADNDRKQIADDLKVATANSARTDRNIIRIAGKLGVDVENPR